MRKAALFLSGTALFAVLSPAFAEQAVPPSRITVTIMEGITSSKQLPSEELVNARKALARGGRIYTAQMRQLADLGDGLAALRFAQWLEAQPDFTDLADIAHYYGVAATTGRGGAITSLIATLDRIDPDDLTPARKERLKTILLRYANAGNSHAVAAVMRYQLSTSPFGSMDGEIAELLETAEGEGTATLALQLAMQIMQDPVHSAVDLQLAKAYLNRATTASSLTTMTTALNLMPLLDKAIAGASIPSTEVTQ